MATDDMKALPKSTSFEPRFPEQQRRLFIEVLELLNRNKVPYVVSGAFALNQHTGIWRDTKDLDVFLPGENVAATMGYLRDDGFETEVADEVWLAKAHRDGFFVDLITGMSNGAVVVEPSWIEHGTDSEILGVPVKVLAPEELIASKIFVTRRERFDGADICHVIYGTHGKLDWRRLQQLITRHGDHWEMLLFYLVLFRYIYPAHTDYVPLQVWQELISRLQHAVEHPNKSAKFRGSLIDENMFWIDVYEWGLPNTLEELRARCEHRIPIHSGTRKAA